MQLLEPKEIQVGDKMYTISKFPAIAGREIVSQYPVTGLPKIGEYEDNKQMMLKLMKYVSVKTGTGEHILSTEALINSHVDNWEDLAKIEARMMSITALFSRVGKLTVSSKG